MSRRENRRKREKREKLISIGILSLIIFGVIFTNSALANGNSTDVRLGNESKIVPVSWSRTPEPKDNSDYINIMKDSIKNTSLEAGENTTNEKYYSNQVIDGKNYIAVDNYPGKSSGVEPQEGKVITTPVAIYTGNNNASRILLDYNTITKLLKPTETNKVWDSNPANGPLYYNGYIKDKDLANYPVKEFATWKHYGNDSWRLFRGEFDLSGYDLTNKRVYLGVLGKNGPELIMPLNDFMIVLVDGKPTDINFTTQRVNDNNKNNIKLRLEDGSIYTPTFKQAYHSWAGSNKCTEHNHTSISKHTDTWHAHLNNEAESAENGYRLGDITPFLNNEANHKIEILCADNTGGGGGTKLDVFVVDAPSMKVEKGGFVIDDTKPESEKKVLINSESTLYPGESVYYTFSMVNDGIDRLKSLEFKDELINIKINSNGVYNLSTGQKLSNDRLQITKISKAEDGTEIKRVTETKDKALELLKELYPNESVIVEDLNNIKYNIVQSDLKRPNGQIINTVIGTAKYLNNQLTSESEASFKVTVAELIEPKLDITKHVFEVIRNGDTIYSAINGSEQNTVPGLYPGDEVSFYFTITNNTKDENRPYNKELPVTNLSLVDKLSNPYKNPKWKFTIVDKNFNEVMNSDFDGNNFDIEAKESVNIVVSNWIVPEPFSINTDNSIEIWDYNVVNTVSLYKENSNGNKELIGSSNANVKILPPKLYLKKVITNAENDDKSLERIFTINIEGNDSSSFTIEAKANSIYIIDNLKYGVTYTVNEVVPANYELESISLQEENGEIVLEGNVIQLIIGNNEKYIVVSNKVSNKNYFYDDTNVTNVLKYPLNKR